MERLPLKVEGSEEAAFPVDAGSCPDTGEKAGQSQTTIILLTTLGVSHRCSRKSLGCDWHLL